jgi:hypothetical protein
MVAITTIDARAKVAQVGVERGCKLWWLTFSIHMNFLRSVSYSNATNAL